MREARLPARLPTRIFTKSRPGERRQKICALFIAPEAILDDNMEAMAIKENRGAGG